jgi:hypothetical protein
MRGQVSGADATRHCPIAPGTSYRACHWQQKPGAGGTMETRAFYGLAADIILVIHTAVVLFIVLGLVLILAGKLAGWRWVHNPWFRLLHLAAILLVVLQSWLGVICPLTNWEMALRSKASATVYEGSFISHWLQQLIYYQAPPWVFTVGYTLFGSLVLLSWYLVRPRPFTSSAGDPGHSQP